MDLVVPDASKTLREGALAPWNPISSNYYPAMLEQAMEQFGVDMDTPFENLKKEEQDLNSLRDLGIVNSISIMLMILVGCVILTFLLKGSLPILIAVTTKRLATLLAIRCCPT